MATLHLILWLLVVIDEGVSKRRDRFCPVWRGTQASLVIEAFRGELTRIYQVCKGPPCGFMYHSKVSFTGQAEASLELTLQAIFREVSVVIPLYVSILTTHTYCGDH
jgi:hypothetical protein